MQYPPYKRLSNDQTLYTLHSFLRFNRLFSQLV
jgi:hypothetical protein